MWLQVLALNGSSICKTLLAKEKKKFLPKQSLCQEKQFPPKLAAGDETVPAKNLSYQQLNCRVR